MWIKQLKYEKQLGAPLNTQKLFVEVTHLKPITRSARVQDLCSYFSELFFREESNLSIETDFQYVLQHQWESVHTGIATFPPFS